MAGNDSWKECAQKSGRRHPLKHVFLYKWTLLLAVVFLSLNGCTKNTGNTENTGASGAVSDRLLEEGFNGDKQEQPEEGAPADPEVIPAYCGEPYYLLGAEPSFADTQYESVSYISLSELDSLGRCGIAEMKVTCDALPTEERGKIGHVKPSGWHTVKYPEVISDLYLYNRCHLLAYCLSGLNDEERNLITGTRYLNMEGMLPFEQQVLAYVRETKDDVLYRVTPVYTGDNLVCDGVLMEAASCDRGKLEFAVYCYNVQPGIAIDYATGNSSLDDSHEQLPQMEVSGNSGVAVVETSEKTAEDYIVNTNTKKYHAPSCPSVEDIKPSNRMDYRGRAEELEQQGYEACKRCKPD